MKGEQRNEIMAKIAAWKMKNSKINRRKWKYESENIMCKQYHNENNINMKYNKIYI